MKSKLLKSGAFFYLDKPIDFQELETQVKRGIEHGMLSMDSFVWGMTPATTAASAAVH